MCGIAGYYGTLDKEVLLRMLDAQKHRGPDGRDIFVVPGQGFAMGHDRLAIIDVVGGAQPIPNEDKSLWVIVNGEIYNYLELKEEYLSRHHFRTKSDSEVVVHLYEEYGPDAIKMLDGMFAVALWGPKSPLLLARDPLGIKPLYYGRDAKGNFYFSSEIKAIVNEIEALHELRNGTHLLLGSISEKEPQLTSYYQFPPHCSEMSDPATAIEKVENVLLQAVKKRLRADVPLGVFLSGGLDSSLISAMTRSFVSGELHSFSVGLEDSQDILNARVVAKELKTVHHELLLTEKEIVNFLPRVVYFLESFDPALVRSAVPTYFVSQLAAQHVKVVLSGEGADELFGGYHYLADIIPNWDDFATELALITQNLHNSNLQRVDRMSMAHGLEGRVPFLDVSLIDLAFRIDPRLKWNGEGKWVLRKVAEKYLPEAIVWRTKEKFAIGTGIGDLLEKYADAVISDEDFDSIRSRAPIQLRSKEECLYWTLFSPSYGRQDIVAEMGQSRSLNPGQRWATSVS